VIVLDEPTNDLDTETLELLEERLVGFQGTLLVVSHDREFLNNVVTSTLVFEEQGIREYVGGYDDWLRARENRPVQPAAKVERPKEPKQPSASQSAKSEPVAQATTAKPARRRLSYKERQELEALPGTIELLEGEIDALHETMAQADFYQQPGEQIAAQRSRLKDLETRLAAAYSRWQELEQAE